MGYDYSQNFYLNNERKTLEKFLSVCVFEMSLCLSDVHTDAAAALHFPKLSSLVVVLRLLSCVIQLTLVVLQYLNGLI